MRGRGLLIAAAVLQLVGAAMALLGVVSILAMAGMPHLAVAPLRAIAVSDALIACGYVVASIFLLYRRRWAWIASLAADGLFGAAFLAIPIVAGVTHGAFGVGLGELFILVILAAPLFVTIGLLIGGRHAVLPAAPPKHA